MATPSITFAGTPNVILILAGTIGSLVHTSVHSDTVGHVFLDTPETTMKEILCPKQ